MSGGNEGISLSVPGRLCLFGEHSDWAAQYGRKEITKTLLTAGAKVNVKDKNGKTPLTVAQNNGHAELADLLLEHGARE